MWWGTAYDGFARQLRQPGKEDHDGPLDMRELVRLATLAPSSHNTQPWKFRIEQDAITILPDFSRRCPVVDPDDAHLFKSLGCATENLVHAAAAQGRVAHPSPDGADGITIRLVHSPAARADELFHAIPHRQCTRKAFDGRPIESDHLSLLERAGTGAGARAIMLTDRTDLDTVADYVAEGDLKQLADPEFRSELVSWIRFNPREAVQKADGLAGRTTGQPPLPRWLAERIIGSVLKPESQAETDSQHVKSSSAMAVFVAEDDDHSAWIEVGRAYERFALQATALGIRHALLNQPNEVPELRRQFESWLGLDHKKILLIARIGHAKLASFSLRRLIDDVIVRS